MTKQIDWQTMTESQSLSEEEMAEKSLIRVYERDSMERFGDDLTEQVMQYLWFSDKVMFECLSKQWQRLVFNKQFGLDLNLYGDYKERKNSLYRQLRTEYNRIDVYKQSLESLLKKCPNIRRVHLNVDGNGKELELITKYCRRVTKLIGPKCCNEECLMSFAAKHGMWLQELSMNDCGCDSPDCLKKFLQMCPNLKSIDIRLGYDFNSMIEESDSLPKLEVIKEVLIAENETKGLEILNKKYGKTLKGLKIEFLEFLSEDLKTCFAHISRFESLESLELELKFVYLNSEEPIDECLKLLAKKCTKLTELRFKTFQSSIKFNRIFFSFSGFRSLERLVLDFGDITDKLEGSVECLKHMTRLKHLSITYPQLTQDFFANIYTTLPNIRLLEINTNHINGELFKPFVESLQTMKCIERVVINYSKQFFYRKNRSESQPKTLIQNYGLLQNITI